MFRTTQWWYFKFLRRLVTLSTLHTANMSLHRKFSHASITSAQVPSCVHLPCWSGASDVLPSSSDSLHAPPVPLLSSQADMRLATRHLSPRRTSPAHLSSQLAFDAFHEQTSPGTAQTSLPNSHSDGTRHHHKATTFHTLLLKILLACILSYFLTLLTMKTQTICCQRIPSNYDFHNYFHLPTFSPWTAKALEMPEVHRKHRQSQLHVHFQMIESSTETRLQAMSYSIFTLRAPAVPLHLFHDSKLNCWCFMTMMMFSMLISMLISMMMVMPRTLLLPTLMSGTLFLIFPAKCRALSSAMTYFLQDFHVRDQTHAHPTNSDFPDSQRHSVLSPQHGHTCHATSGWTWTPALALPSTPAVAASPVPDCSWTTHAGSSFLVGSTGTRPSVPHAQNAARWHGWSLRTPTQPDIIQHTCTFLAFSN